MRLSYALILSSAVVLAAALLSEAHPDGSQLHRGDSRNNGSHDGKNNSRSMRKSREYPHRKEQADWHKYPRKSEEKVHPSKPLLTAPYKPPQKQQDDNSWSSNYLPMPSPSNHRFSYSQRPPTEDRRGSFNMPDHKNSQYHPNRDSSKMPEPSDYQQHSGGGVGGGYPPVGYPPVGYPPPSVKSQDHTSSQYGDTGAPFPSYNSQGLMDMPVSPWDNRRQSSFNSHSNSKPPPPSYEEATKVDDSRQKGNGFYGDMMGPKYASPKFVSDQPPPLDKGLMKAAGTPLYPTDAQRMNFPGADRDATLPSDASGDGKIKRRPSGKLLEQKDKTLDESAQPKKTNDGAWKTSKRRFDGLADSDIPEKQTPRRTASAKKRRSDIDEFVRHNDSLFKDDDDED